MASVVKGHLHITDEGGGQVIPDPPFCCAQNLMTEKVFLIRGLRKRRHLCYIIQVAAER